MTKLSPHSAALSGAIERTAPTTDFATQKAETLLNDTNPLTGFPRRDSIAEALRHFESVGGMEGYARGYKFASERGEQLRAALEALVSLHDQPRSSFTAAEYAAMEQGVLEQARAALRNQ